MSRRIVALISDVKVVRVRVLIGNLSLPLLRREERLVLDTQTGCRKSNGLSALAGSRSGGDEESRQNQETESLHARHRTYGPTAVRVESGSENIRNVSATVPMRIRAPSSNGTAASIRRSPR